MSNEYLLKEYELCFEQLRFYDTRQESLLKYLCSLTSAVVAAEFAVYQLAHGGTAGFFGCEVLLSGLVFIATVLLFLAMLQNRLYFVFIARQLNAIRGHLMKIDAAGFGGNQLYTSPNFSALKVMSVHTFQLVGAALISSLFAACSVFGLRPALGCKYQAASVVVVFFVVFVAEAGGGIRYLLVQGRHTADKAVHRQ